MTFLRETMNIINAGFHTECGIKGLFLVLSHMHFIVNFSGDTGKSRIGFLWKYLERSCYLREWEPGRFFV